MSREMLEMQDLEEVLDQVLPGMVESMIRGAEMEGYRFDENAKPKIFYIRSDRWSGWCPGSKEEIAIKAKALLDWSPESFFKWIVNETQKAVDAAMRTQD